MEVLLEEVAHLWHLIKQELPWKLLYTSQLEQAKYPHPYSQKRVSCCVLDAADGVHVHIVIMQCFRGGSASRFSQQNPQPAAQLHRTARLRLIILQNYTFFNERSSNVTKIHCITSRAAISVLARMMRKAKGCLGPRPGKTSTPLRANALTWVWMSPLSLWRYRVPFLTQHQRSFQHWFTRTFK